MVVRQKCHLFDAQSGHKVKVCYHKITINADDASLLQQQGWSFDWSLTAEETVIRLTIKNSNVIQGLAAYNNDEKFIKLDLVESAPYNRGRDRRYVGVGLVLFAIIATISFEVGDDGYVLFVPKTKLHDYYAHKFGAKDIGDGNQYFDTAAAKKLIGKFTEEKINDD